MGGRAFLTENKNDLLDFAAVKTEFRKPYNHSSCVSYVLSIKYKLYSIGIDLSQHSPVEAARLYTDAISAKNYDNTTIDELSWLEQRRWVTEKLCLHHP